MPAGATDDDLIKQSILQILTTTRGERVMRPDFGTNLYDLIFENNNTILDEMIRLEVTNAIASFEPRVIVQQIDVSSEDNLVSITMFYVVIATQEQDSLSVSIVTAQ